MIKVDLHMHSGEDPKDGLPYPATALIDRAVELGFAAIAITLHGAVLDDERVFDYARQKELLLISGAEWLSPHGDVLLFNLRPAELARLRTMADLRALRQARGPDLLTIAPHPFYFKHSLHGHLAANADLFDAIEYCHFHFPWLNRNRPAERVAARLGKPLVATSDAHALWMFGDHYTLVDAAPTIPDLFAAIRAGRVRSVSPPETLDRVWRMAVTDKFRRRRPGQITASFPP